MAIFKCSHIDAITDDIAAITLTPTQEIRHFIAGQYVNVTHPHLKGMPISIVNTPNPAGILVFHLRHDAKHPNADLLIRYLVHNPYVQVDAAQGHCTLQHAKPHDSLLLLAGGTGIAPYLGLLETALLKEAYHQPISLLWGVKNPQDAYAMNILEELSQNFKQFTYHVVLSDNTPAWQGLRGMLHEVLPIYAPCLKTTLVMACGPYPMVGKCFEVAKSLGATRELFLSDMMPS